MKFGIPPISRLKRDDWHFVLSLFLPVFIALLIITGNGRTTQAHVVDPAPTNVPKPATAAPAIKLEWGRFGGHGVDKLKSYEPTPLGHVGREDHAKMGRTRTVYEMSAVLLGERGYPDAEEAINWCRVDLPIIENDWEAGAPDDGCNGCEGPVRKLLGYKDYCGPFRFYSEEDCKQSTYDVGLEWLRYQYPHVTSSTPFAASGPSPWTDGWYHGLRNGVRFVCSPVQTDEYPIDFGELRNWRPLEEWPWYNQLSDVYKTRDR